MHVSTQTLIWLTASLILSGIFFYAEDTAPHNSLGTDEPVTLRFTSGAGNETGRQRVLMKLEPGRYRLQMTQEGSRYSDQWLIWDYLALEADKDPVWKIGRDDTGSDSPDYSEKAFSEFSRKGAPDETTHFVVGQTQAKNFCRELNDNDRTDASIEFSVSEEDSKKKLTLLLSTLYSTHTRARDFEMKLQLQPIK